MDVAEAAAAAATAAAASVAAATAATAVPSTAAATAAAAAASAAASTAAACQCCCCCHQQCCCCHCCCRHQQCCCQCCCPRCCCRSCRRHTAADATRLEQQICGKILPRPTRPTKGKGRAEAEGAGTAAQTAADLALNRRAPRMTVLWPRIPPSGCHRGAGGCEGPKEGDPRHSSAPRCDVWRRAAPPRPRFNREAMREGLPPFGCH